MKRNKRTNINTADYWNRKSIRSMGQANEYIYGALANEVMEYIEENNLKSVSIFDVGCAAGQMLTGIKKRIELDAPSTTVRVGGIDISETMIFRAKENEPTGIFYADDINNFITKPLDPHWDMIISNHTFEHIENPDKVMDFFIDSKVKLCLINVPYTTHIDNEEHIYYFNKQSFKEHNDIKTIYLEEDGKWKTIMFIFKVS